RRADAGRVDVDDADLVRIDAGAFYEGRPLLELRAARGHRHGSAFEVLERTDRRLVQHHDGGRVAPVDGADGLDRHALGDAVGDDETVRETDRRRLAGDELRRGAGALA